MLNYRVQTCLDSTTYELLKTYMEELGYETVSVAVRKLIRDSLHNKICGEIGVGDEDCKTVKL